MKRLLVLFLLSFLPAPAQAGVPCSVPFTLTNGSIADATQVMANYNALIACLALAAAAGANADITSMTGLTTPLAPAFGGSSNYVGGTSSGTANAIVVASATPSGFTLVAGNKLAFIPPGNNSGPTTLNVTSVGIKNVMRVDPTVGITSLGGGELVGGQMAQVVYDGTQYQISNPAHYKPIGEVFDMAGLCPLGSVEAIGQAVSATTFPGLSSVLGTIWGTSSGNVVLPDLRGRATFSRDSGGSGNISVGGGNFDGTIIGNRGGQQFQVLTQAQLPNIGLAFSGNAPGSVGVTGGQVWGTVNNVQGGPGPGNAPNTNNFGAGSVALPTPSGTVTVGGTTNLGSSQLHPVLSPAAITIKCVRL
jgi:microcystin-dependent protein